MEILNCDLPVSQCIPVLVIGLCAHERHDLCLATPILHKIDDSVPMEISSIHENDISRQQ